MMLLTRIFVHNWHRFHNHIVDVDESLYFCGHNGSGKSTLLDAIQLVLVADLQRMRFNSSAQERSARNLDSYARGKLGEDRYLRPGNTVSYVALEFCSSNDGVESSFTAGVCIEAGPQRSPERTYFIVKEKLDREFFLDGKAPRPRRDLRSLLRRRPRAQAYDGVAEYQADLLAAMGGLSERFSDLFMRALTFQPIRNIRSFVEQWLLEKQDLDLDTLRRVTERLGDLRIHCKEVNEQILALDGIVSRQGEVRRLRALRSEYVVLIEMLKIAAAEEDLQRAISERETLFENSQRVRDEASVLETTLSTMRSELLQHQVFLQNSDVGRRKVELLKEIAQVEERMSEQRSLRIRTLQELKRGMKLAPNRSPDWWSDDETQLAEAAVASRNWLVALTSEKMSGEDVMERTIAAQREVDSLARLVEGEAARRDADLKQVLAKGSDLQRRLQQFKGARKPEYPAAVERLRLVLHERGISSAKLLCELVEVSDPKWQNAVEAMLGPRRFNVIVEPEDFDAALETVDDLRRREKLSDVGLVDIGRAAAERRGAQPNSLAGKVESLHPLVRTYIENVLGDIILAGSVLDLKESRRAITPECVQYSEWTVRAIPSHRFQPWFVGSRAITSQIEALERQLEECSENVREIQQHLEVLGDWREFCRSGRALVIWEERLRQCAESPHLDSRHRELTALVDALDTSSLEVTEREIARIGSEISKEENRFRTLIAESARLEAKQEEIEKFIVQREQEAESRRDRLKDVEQSEPEVWLRALRHLEDRGADAGTALRIAESSLRGFETRMSNEAQRLTEDATAYNIRHQFAGNASNPDESRYNDERVRLVSSSLPGFQKEIEDEQRKAEHELREHILHRLREQIINAKSQLERLNRALKGLEFRGDSYRFRWYPSQDMREFYDLVMEASAIGSAALMESDYYAKNRESFDRFYEMLTLSAQNEAERLRTERLTDYRGYLEYDIEVTHGNGQVSRLSRIIGQTSGGETQTPFYLTIAASFLQMYTSKERAGREAARLVVFDEAFSKMDQERIASTLDLFHNFGLQVVTATPIERCEYLVPRMKTSLVLTAVGDDVVIEPYKNYQAALSRMTREISSAQLGEE